MELLGILIGATSLYLALAGIFHCWPFGHWRVDTQLLTAIMQALISERTKEIGIAQHWRTADLVNRLSTWGHMVDRRRLVHHLRLLVDKGIIDTTNGKFDSDKSGFVIRKPIEVKWGELDHDEFWDRFLRSTAPARQMT